MTASIAGFKACEVISSLKKQGHQIQIVTTPSTKNFIGNMTLEGLSGNPVLNDTFQEGHAMSHIDLIKWADLIITCPITANKLNEFASGLGRDLLTTLFLSYDFKRPWLMVPAMNPTMYQHPITKSSVQKLKDLELIFVGPGSGDVACGDYGVGRMSEPAEILSAISDYL